jgi:hypothetical protein
VMYRGHIVADLVADDTDLEEVGRLMGGLHEEPNAAHATSPRERAPRVH